MTRPVADRNRLVGQPDWGGRGRRRERLAPRAMERCTFTGEIREAERQRAGTATTRPATTRGSLGDLAKPDHAAPADTVARPPRQPRAAWRHARRLPRPGRARAPARDRQR